MSIYRFTVCTVGLVAGLWVAGTAEAACNATINGRPMTWQECQTIVSVYGSVIPGHYLADDQGNWVNRANPYHRGNIYQDAQRRRYGGGGSSGGDGGMTCGTFGCVGGGGYYDPETGSSVGPD